MSGSSLVNVKMYSSCRVVSFFLLAMIAAMTKGAVAFSTTVLLVEQSCAGH
jgi:hypothetical protein